MSVNQLLLIFGQSLVLLFLLGPFFTVIGLWQILELELITTNQITAHELVQVILRHAKEKL